MKIWLNERVRNLSLVAAMLISSGWFPTPAVADTLTYAEITDPIISASFAGDSAALTAHRFVAGFEVNSVELVDVGGIFGILNLSDSFFGTADALLDPAVIDQGLLGTGLISAAIDPSFYPALASG